MKTTIQTLVLATMLSSFPAQAQQMPVDSHPANRSLTDAPIFVAPPPPRGLGAPGRRSDGAGSRGCGNEAQASPVGEPLTALVPLYESTNAPDLTFGTTSAERPTLWVYVPYQPPNVARFVLLKAGEVIYDTDVALPDTPGVIGVSLPDTLPPLEVGEPYHWFFNVYCQSPPPLAFVEGWLQREALPLSTATQLAQLPPQEQIEFYASNGLWHDALTTAAELHQRDTADASWPDLLQAVGLEDLAVEPIVDF